MLEPIPQSILSHSCTLKVCTGEDAWQHPTWKAYNLSKVCFQPSNETRKAKDNTEVVLRSLLFFDAVRSRPGIDVDALQRQSESSGKPMELVFRGNSYTVLTVETLYDDDGRLHHYEVGLV